LFKLRGKCVESSLVYTFKKILSLLFCHLCELYFYQLSAYSFFSLSTVLLWLGLRRGL
jgi:hypothetical protein